MKLRGSSRVVDMLTQNVKNSTSKKDVTKFTAGLYTTTTTTNLKSFLYDIHRVNCGFADQAGRGTTRRM